MKSIHLAEGLELPAEDLLESAIGIIGKRGRGKSGAVKVLMEQLVDVGLPFVAFDPVGIMWGIRSSFDGSGPGLPVLVIGGEHGDVPLDRKAGATVAQRIVKENVSAVIDFSDEPKAAYREFIRDFAHELFRRNDTPRLVILEEAPELVPQRVMGDRADTFEAVERLVSRGRNKGLGVVLVSQRAATINKDVLTQVDALLVMGLAAPQDRKALGDWIKAWDQENRAEEFDKGLAALKRQEGWFWSPEAFGGIFLRTRVREFRTFHPDKTHLRRMGWLKVRPVTADVAGVVARFKGEKLAREEDVDAKERKQYEDRIYKADEVRVKAQREAEGLRQHVASLEKEVGTWREKHSYQEAVILNVHQENEHLKQALKERGVDGSLIALPPVPGPKATVSERIDLHVDRLTPNLTIHEKVVTKEASSDDTMGRLALLVADGFFDQSRSSNAMRDEFRSRGWGAWIGGAAHTNMLKACRQFAEWGFLREDGKQFMAVPEAKDRIKRVREEVAV
jgi:hypothetical protein